MSSQIHKAPLIS